MSKELILIEFNEKINILVSQVTSLGTILGESKVVIEVCDSVKKIIDSYETLLQIQKEI